jgi:flagellar hook-basal body complex protein FliE
MEVGKMMGNELAGMIKADLAALTQDANSLAQLSVAPAQPGVSAEAGFSFAQSMKDALASVNQQDHAAAQRMSDVDSGKSDDLVGAMLSSQQASLSFSMLMQVRNKVMGAVDELLKLPV